MGFLDVGLDLFVPESAESRDDTEYADDSRSKGYILTQPVQGKAGFASRPSYTTTHNDHSNREEQASTSSSKHKEKVSTKQKEKASTSSSKERQIQRQQNELKYWSGLSVRVAMAVMRANGSETIAQKVCTIVLAEGIKQSGQKLSSKMMHALSVKLSVSVLEAGGDQKMGLAVMNAVMAYDNKYEYGKSAESSTLIDSSSIGKSKIVSSAQSIAPSVRSNQLKSLSTTSSNKSQRSKLFKRKGKIELSAQSSTPSIRSDQSSAFSTTSSHTSKRSKLRSIESIEMKTLEKQRAILEAELNNQEREREFNEQMAALDAATNERLASLELDSTRWLPEEVPLTNEENQDSQVDECKDCNIEEKQDDNGDDKVKAFQSGIDDFVLGFNEQMAALEVAANETFDATKEAFLDVIGLTQNEHQDTTVDDSSEFDATKETVLEKEELMQNEHDREDTAEDDNYEFDVTKEASLEKEESTQNVHEETTEDDGMIVNDDTKQEDISEEVSAFQNKVRAFRSVTDDFISGFSEQMATFVAAARERLAGSDKRVEALQDNAMSPHDDILLITADECRNVIDDLKHNEDYHDNDKKSPLQMLTSQFYQSFDCSVDNNQDKMPLNPPNEKGERIRVQIFCPLPSSIVIPVTLKNIP